MNQPVGQHALKQFLTHDQVRALLDLIEFHDDWDEVSEIVGTDVPALYDKLHDLFADY